MYEDKPVLSFPDLSASLMKRRKEFNQVKRELRSKDILFALLHPATLRVTLPDGGRKFFQTPKAAAAFRHDTPERTWRTRRTEPTDGWNPAAAPELSRINTAVTVVMLKVLRYKVSNGSYSSLSLLQMDWFHVIPPCLHSNNFRNNVFSVFFNNFLLHLKWIRCYLKNLSQTEPWLVYLFLNHARHVILDKCEVQNPARERR